MLRRRLAHKLARSEGLSLLEIILAVTIVVVSLTALVTIANTATRTVGAARGRTIADQHVRAGTEQMRFIRDNQGWSGLLGVGTSYELAPNTTRYYSLNSAGALTYRTATLAADVCSDSAVRSTTNYRIDTGYYRVVKMSLNGAGGEATITVTVCYDYRGSLHQSAHATTILTNWR